MFTHDLARQSTSGFHSDSVEITSCVYTKTINNYSFQSQWKMALGISTSPQNIVKYQTDDFTADWKNLI